MSPKKFSWFFALLGLALMPSWGGTAMRDDIQVTLEIVDEHDHPIPYATVWGYLLPRVNKLAVNADDLLRLTTRYQSSFEFALAVSSNRPVPYLRIFPMGDEIGRFQYKINYQYEEGSAVKRPDKITMGFAVMKRGYYPAFINFMATNESALSGKVVLKLDPKHLPESKNYLVKFESLRFELSNTSRNEEISASNYERISQLRMELEIVAQQALAARDQKAAALIYARMQYLPSISFLQGEAVGFSQAEPISEQSQAYLAKAYNLDPANSYIAAKYMFRQGAIQYGGYTPEKASEEQRRSFMRYLNHLHILMRSHGKEIWPANYQLYAHWLHKSSDPNDRALAVSLLKELYRDEPKFDTLENLLRIR